MRRGFRLRRLAAFAGALLGSSGVAGQGMLASPPAAAPGLALQLETELQPANLNASDARPAFGRADELLGRVDRDTTLQGDAELRQGGTAVRARRLTLYHDDETLIAIGDVRVARGGLVFTGPQLQLRLDSGEGVFDSPRFAVPETGGRGRAARIDFLGRDRVSLSDAVYTTCRSEDPDWYLQAETLSIDRLDQEGVARSARLYFKDLPVLATPYFAFPMGDERRSGFLAPTLSITSTTGAEVRVPYYFNIAPNRDFTLFTTVSDRRGLQWGGTARYLEPHHFGVSSFEYTHNDWLAGRDRWLFNSEHASLNVAGWSGGWLLRGVSDDQYFVDYSRSIVQSAERSLPRDVFVQRNLGELEVRALVLKYQNILEARAAPPYNRLPQLTALFRRTDWHGLDVAANADVSVFQRDLDGSAEGARMLVQPAVAYTFGDPGWFVTPRVAVHASAYRLSSNPVGATDLDRVVPTASLDSGLVFERSARLGGQAVTQTFEPRLLYVYTPYQDQSQMPVFDTAYRALGFATLFSDNVFSGGDRVADANQLTGGAISRFIDPATGVESLRLAIAQRWYFKDQRVTLPGVPLRTDSQSDLLLAVNGELGHGHGIDAGLQWSVGTQTVPRAGLAWRYWPAYDRLFNVALRYQERDYAQIDTSWRWPVTRRWNSLGRFNFSVLREQVNPATGVVVPVDPQLLEGLVGLEYQADCWVARFVAQRFVTATAVRTSAFFVQLELSGLARIGLDPFDILARNIPGYRPPSQRMVAPSLFHGYE